MYIQYTMDQLCLPMDLEEDMPDNHLARVVNAAVERLDDTIFDAPIPAVAATAATLRCLSKSLFTLILSESIRLVKSLKPCERTSLSCGWPDGNAPTSAPLIASVPSG